MSSDTLSKLGLSTFISIDVESTGLNLNKDKIIEIAACKYVDGQLVDTFSKLVNPNIEISPFISNLTGIKNEDLINKPNFYEISNDFISFIKGFPLVGHNIQFDLNFINKELNASFNIYSQDYISDTYFLSRIFLFYFNSFKLSSLCESLDIEIETLHRAEDDAINSAKLFLKLIDIIVSVNVNSLNSLNNCIKHSNSINKELINNFVHYLINENKGNISSNYYSNRTPDSFLFTNKATSVNEYNIEEVFSQDGLLSKEMKNYEFRDNQFYFSKDCLKNIESSGILIAEAETGIGKSFSYLISALLSNKKVIVSSSTHNLQSQLFTKDIPSIAKALDIDVVSTIVKGMNNYLCNDRYENMINQINNYLNEEEIQDFLPIVIWSDFTKTGDISECNGFRYKDNEKIWNLVKYEMDICPANNSSYHNNCYYQKMMQNAKKSNLLVINHALLVSSLSKQSPLIDDDTVCIIDEGHKLIENCREQLKETARSTNIHTLYENLILFFNKIDKNDALIVINQYNSIKNKFENLLSGFKVFSVEFGTKLLENRKVLEYNNRLDVRYNHNLAIFDSLSFNPDYFIELIDNIIKEIELFRGQLNNSLNNLEKNSLGTILNRTKDLSQKFRNIFINKDKINWASIYLSSKEIKFVSFNSTPFSINDFINDLSGNFDSLIICSATLTINGEFDYFINELGLNQYMQDKAITLKRYSSNFYHQDQTKLFVLNSNYDVNSYEYFFKIFNIISKVKKDINKRMLVLCTSYQQIKTLKDIYLKQTDKIDKNILFQDSNSSRQILLNSYIKNSGSILVGTNTFWEGIDLPNDMLELLLIVKLPFSNPFNPIVEAKIDYYRSLGVNPFVEYQLPEAILKLRQGIGRLIRNQDDMGICILSDPRLLNKKYGRLIIDSLNLTPNKFSDEGSLIDLSKKFLGC